MAKAIVRLTRSETYSARGRSFKKGFPQTLTDKAEIEFFRTKGGFTVQDIGEPPPVKAPVPPVDEDEDTGVDPEDLDDDEDGDDDDATEVEILTKAQLKELTKKQLVVVGEERLVLFTGNEKKNDMINQILEAQEQLQTEEGDDDDEDDE